MGVWMIQMIYITAGVYMVIENFNYELLYEPYTFHVSLYFIVVTISTVGYGDYFPVTMWGKIFILAMILYVIAYKLSSLVNELLRLIFLKSFYERASYTFNPEIPLVVITGHVALNALENVSVELFHPDHGSQERHAVIVQPVEPNNNTKMFISDPKHSNSILYLKGNPMSTSTMHRASLSDADACIIMTNNNAQDAYAVDHKNILIGLAMKKYVKEIDPSKNLRLCL